MSLLVAVGDIHGYYDKFVDLMARLIGKGWYYDEHQYIFLGDYIDGGPKSKTVIENLRCFQQLHPNWVFLLGNHEHMMLDAVLYDNEHYGNPFVWYNQGGRATAESYAGQKLDPYYFKPVRELMLREAEGDMEWIQSLPTIYETSSFYFVHAGLQPGRAAPETSDFDRLWLRGKFIDSPYDWGKRVVFGHTPRLDGPLLLTNKIGLDTMHHGRGRITAAILDDETGEVVEFVQSYE